MDTTELAKQCIAYFIELDLANSAMERAVAALNSTEANYASAISHNIMTARDAQSVLAYAKAMALVNKAKATHAAAKDALNAAQARAREAIDQLIKLQMATLP